MIFVYDGIEYDVDIIKKNNKNTYVRVKDGKIVVTTSYFTSRRSIIKLLESNRDSIGRMINKKKKRDVDEGSYCLFGEVYKLEFILDKKVIVDDENKIIRTFSLDYLEKYMREYAKGAFEKHLREGYYKFEENIPSPSLFIRKMKSRWGVCNTKTYRITLNLELIHYPVHCLDYVIIHELAHLMVPNHSKEFWNVVSKYCVDYKNIRKELRNVC